MTNNEKKLSAKLIIFDLDGTLADTVESITEAMNAALTEMGLPLRDEAYIRRSVGNGSRTLCVRVLPEDRRDDATVAKLLKIYDRTYGETYMHVKSLYPGMTDALEALHARGKWLFFRTSRTPTSKISAAHCCPRDISALPRVSSTADR